MNPIQIILFALGIAVLLIAGLQDKKTRLAPAIYLTPTIFALAISFETGLFAFMVSVLVYFFWKEEWNNKFGLADMFLLMTMFFWVLIEPVSIFLIAIIVSIDILFFEQKNTSLPMIWVYAKSIVCFILFITGLVVGLILRGFLFG